MPLVLAMEQISTNYASFLFFWPADHFEVRFTSLRCVEPKLRKYRFPYVKHIGAKIFLFLYLTLAYNS
jgi:hypothetical protein